MSAPDFDVEGARTSPLGGEAAVTAVASKGPCAGLLSVELCDCGRVLEEQVAAGSPQKAVALTYAFALCSSEPVDWRRINGAIQRRWPHGLERVKRAAWRLVEEKR
jgi:hypothetical protein